MLLSAAVLLLNVAVSVYSFAFPRLISQRNWVVSSRLALIAHQPQAAEKKSHEIEYKRKGDGHKITKGDIIEVAYLARIDGSMSYLAENVVGRYTVGDGTMIQGWDDCIQQLSVGDHVAVTIPSNNAYGPQGIETVVPGNSNLCMDIRVLQWLGNVDTPETIFQGDPQLNGGSTDNGKSKPGDRFSGGLLDIYKRRMANISFGFAGSNFFASQTGEAPPWILNPNITFPAMISIVIAAFLTVLLSGGVREKGVASFPAQPVSVVTE